MRINLHHRPNVGLTYPIWAFWLRDSSHVWINTLIDRGDAAGEETLTTSWQRHKWSERVWEMNQVKCVLRSIQSCQP